MNEILMFALLPTIALSLIGGSMLTEAQSEIEDYTIADKTVKFQRIQFEFYVLLSDIGNGDQFISDLELERAKQVLKAMPIKPKKELWCDNETFGKIYRFYGAYVFKESVGADQVKNWFKNNLPLDKIRYGEYYLLNNNHHWDKPNPDEIIEHIIYGNEVLFDKTSIECLNASINS